MVKDACLRQWIREHVPSQAGRRAIVTGATSGIGYETALELARAGAEVVLAVRDDQKASEATARIRAEAPGAQVRGSKLDLSSLQSVREFAIREGTQPLNLLINNAGALPAAKRELTTDGFERALGTNYLGPFALTGLLLDALLASPGARVITVSSAASRYGKIDLQDIRLDRNYTGNGAYARSKLADLIFARELQRRFTQRGLFALSIACHPGYAITNLQNGELSLSMKLISGLLRPIASHDAAHGALPTLYAATANDAEPGGYYCPDGFLEATGFPAKASLPKSATDEGLARSLWSLSESVTGVRYPCLE